MPEFIWNGEVAVTSEKDEIRKGRAADWWENNENYLIQGLRAGSVGRSEQKGGADVGK
jgi:hypothetical protein